MDHTYGGSRQRIPKKSAIREAQEVELGKLVVHIKKVAGLNRAEKEAVESALCKIRYPELWQELYARPALPPQPTASTNSAAASSTSSSPSIPAQVEEPLPPAVPHVNQAPSYY